MNDIKQLPINFSFYEIKSFFNYIPGNNIFIIETLRGVANENSHNLIFLVGATSSGKTHLCASTYEESKKNKLYYNAENIHKLNRENIEDFELLILDDSFSSLDTETEDIILSNLKKRISTTFIIISHRISSLKNMSKIISIKNGQIIEEGNHEELIKLNGMYADLYKKQINKN